MRKAFCVVLTMVMLFCLTPLVPHSAAAHAAGHEIALDYITFAPVISEEVYPEITDLNQIAALGIEQYENMTVFGKNTVNKDGYIDVKQLLACTKYADGAIHESFVSTRVALSSLMNGRSGRVVSDGYLDMSIVHKTYYDMTNVINGVVTDVPFYRITRCETTITDVGSNSVYCTTFTQSIKCNDIQQNSHPGHTDSQTINNPVSGTTYTRNSTCGRYIGDYLNNSLGSGVASITFSNGVVWTNRSSLRFYLI